MECSICLTAVLQEQKKTTACKHTFHKDCLDEWTKDHATCPLCRQSIEHAPRFFPLLPSLFVAEEPTTQAYVPLSFWFSRPGPNAIPLVAVPLAFPEEYQPSGSVNMTRISDTILNLTAGGVSFALHPEEYQPSATANGSRITDAILNLTAE